MSVAPSPARRPRPPRGQASTRSGAAAPRARSGIKRRVTTRPVRAVVPAAAGLVWALALLGAVAASSLLTALVMLPVALLATATGIRATESKRKKRSHRPSTLLLVALAVCVVDPVAALGGPLVGLAVGLASAGALAVMVMVSVFTVSVRPARTAASRLLVVLAPASAATGLVLARHQGSTLALFLVLAVLAYDVAAFVMGNGRSAWGGPVGVGFAAVGVAVVAVFASAILDPPMSGSRPWLMFAVLAAAAFLGVRLCQWAVGAQRLPALRRLDSLSAAAPAWFVMAAVVLHR